MPVLGFAKISEPSTGTPAYWIGKSKSELISDWGQPDRILQQDEGELIFSYRNVIDNQINLGLGINSNTWQSDRRDTFEFINFFINRNGIITDFRIESQELNEDHKWGTIIHTAVIVGLIVLFLTLMNMTSALNGLD